MVEILSDVSSLARRPGLRSLPDDLETPPDLDMQDAYSPWYYRTSYGVCRKALTMRERALQ